MDPIEINCTCGVRLRFRAEHEGKRTRCPKCRTVVLVERESHESEELYLDFDDDVADEYPNLETGDTLYGSRRGYSLQEGRAYVHEICRQPTLVTEEDFAGICNPLLRSRPTYCCHCQRHDSLFRFEWADTGETISKYRARLHRDYAPPNVKAALWGLPVLAAVAAGLATYVPSGEPVLAFSAALLALCLTFFHFNEIIAELIGPKYYRIK